MNFLKNASRSSHNEVIFLRGRIVYIHLLFTVENMRKKNKMKKMDEYFEKLRPPAAADGHFGPPKNG